ncbi:MAG: alpha/beta fold hydrolase [Gelidibacter sp.]
MSNTVQNKRILKLKKTIFILLGLYVMIGASLYFIQEKLLFHPSVLPTDYTYQFSEPFEEFFLKADDGAVINAIHFKIENPKGVILYFHGNAGDLSRWGTIAEFFVKQQFDVFIMDYRTYGKSTGVLSEEALYKDAQMCYDHLLKYYNAATITMYGRSLGTGIATYLASKNKAKQLILETPYYSMIDMAHYRFPIFPVKYLLKYKLPTHEFIMDVQCPITIFHGTDDSVVPFDSGKKLFDSLSNHRAKFIQIDGGHHNDLMEYESYHKALKPLLY